MKGNGTPANNKKKNRRSIGRKSKVRGRTKKPSKQKYGLEGGGGCHSDSEKPESSRRKRPVSPSFCLFSSLKHTYTQVNTRAQNTHSCINAHNSKLFHSPLHVFLSHAIFIHSSSLPLLYSCLRPPPNLCSAAKWADLTVLLPLLSAVSLSLNYLKAGTPTSACLPLTPPHAPSLSLLFSVPSSPAVIPSSSGCSYFLCFCHVWETQIRTMNHTVITGTRLNKV